MSPFLLRRKGLGKTSCETIAANSTTGIQVHCNDQEWPTQPDIVFRWGTTSNLPGNPLVVNSAKAIHTVADKAGFRRVLQKHKLCPKTWFEDELPDDILLIKRPLKHAQGKDLTLFQGLYPVPKGYYASELIEKNQEFRVYVVSNRVICVAEKLVEDKTQVAWNHSLGGKFVNVKWSQWPLKTIQKSLEAFALSGLDFGGVDIIQDKEGNPYVLEINTACSLTSPYRQKCFAKAFDYIVTNGTAKWDVPDYGISSYHQFIHPAITESST